MKQRFACHDGRPQHGTPAMSPTAVLRESQVVKPCLTVAQAWFAGLLCLIACAGCLSQGANFRREGPPIDLDHYRQLATQVERADPAQSLEKVASPPPLSMSQMQPREFWPLTLPEAIYLTLSNSTVMRDLGGTVLRAPIVAQTIHGVNIVETDPRFGIENALSAFDAQFSTQMFYEQNDRAINNVFLGGGTRLFEQDLGTMRSSLSKFTATGTQYTIRHNTQYDANNSPGNLFPSAWDTNIETEFRHPLLQGAGIEYNRIAGPNGQPGLFNGVVLARINTDISQADFEIGIRNLVADVENAYWDLYFAYRDLQAKVLVRNNSLETWRRIHALYVVQKRGGEADREAAARENYYRFQEEVENAISGPIQDGTRTFNGSNGGAFRGTPGVQLAERRLRLLMGVPINDGRQVRPADEPTAAPVNFDWSTITVEAMQRRPELRRQRWVIKRREMELAASRNLLLPRFDVLGRYRWRGFGHTLLPTPDSTPDPFDNAYANMLGGDFQEWQMGLEFNAPLGFRRGHTTVRNAQYVLARERSVLNEQEREVMLGLSNAAGDLERTQSVLQTSYNRLLATRDQMQAVQTAYDADKASLDALFDVQRRMSEAEIRYQRALVEHVTAIRNVHFEKGTSLDYNEIFLTASPTDMRTTYNVPPAEGVIDYRMNGLPRGSSENVTPPAGENVAPQETLPQQTSPGNAVPGTTPPGVGPQLPPMPGNGVPPNLPPAPNTIPPPARDSSPPPAPRMTAVPPVIELPTVSVQ